MCCLFGLLDYGDSFHGRDKSRIISVLSKECEVRGTDATGIAYVCRDKLRVFKRPLPAHRMHFFLPAESPAIMGHTRMTTQGCERYNPNNHPFEGRCGNTRFALAHNGILHNDSELRKKYRLPQTKIRTDSYVAVQLLERQGILSMDSLKEMAEAVEGSFSFTLLDSENNLYFIKGNSPLCIYHFKRQRLYLYASTEEILRAAVQKLRMDRLETERILPECGEILKINRKGEMETAVFDSSNLPMGWGFPHGFSWPGWRLPESGADEYVRNLKSMAGYYGYAPEDIDVMRAQGYSCGEIEEILCGDDLLEEF